MVEAESRRYIFCFLKAIYHIDISYLIIIIIQAYSKVLNFKNTYQVHAVECVSKIKLILSIIFHAINGALYTAHPFLL